MKYIFGDPVQIKHRKKTETLEELERELERVFTKAQAHLSPYEIGIYTARVCANIFDGYLLDVQEFENGIAREIKDYYV